MASRSKRREARNKRQRQSASASPVFDLHAQAMVDSWDGLLRLLKRLAAADDPAAALDGAFDQAVAAFVAKVQRFDPIRLIEVARQRFLPMAPEGEMPVTADAGATKLELLALIALASKPEADGDSTPDSERVEAQEMSSFVSEAGDDLDDLLRLAQTRSFAAVDRNNKLALVSLLIQGAEVWIRNPSYPEMVEATNLVLLDGYPSVRAALDDELGFDGSDALAVLNACHDLQIAAMNDRIDAMRDTVLEAMAATDTDLGDERRMEVASSLMSVFEPSTAAATVAVDDIVAHTGITETRVRAIVERFRLTLGTLTPEDVINAFISGKNPMRARPLLVGSDGRIMLAHSALNVFAVRENLEEHLKTSSVWSQYAKHRGDLLESLTRSALGRVLPGADYRDAFLYYVPGNDAEAAVGDPAKYTKRVEGDHLMVLDDVAIIVEDKAVALSALSRGGKIARIRTDLIGIIKEAAEQSGRMRDAIERDGGLRIEDEGWVDLSHIREIHTIAVSLDDLSTVLTATAELVRAGLLTLGNIPWTVSLHDLELITELIARPAEFLLYLRRRRDPDVTVMFNAPDELDLFLHFFNAGLWVEPDPAQVRAAFPFMPQPTTAELRRYRSQTPVLLTSRTDELDRWFHSNKALESVPKPAMVPSPLAPLIDELQARQVTGWISIGATLLSMETQVQHRFARHADDLLNHPLSNGQGRSLTIPLTGSVDPADGWLLVWATRPAGEDPVKTEKSLRGYLRAKKHQLGLPRGAVFLYDEPTRDLVGVFYDGHIGPLDTSTAAVLSYLRPPSDLQRTVHPNAKHPARTTKSAPRKKKRE